jgi:hypothetical protein
VKDGRIVVFPEEEGGYDPARLPSVVSLTEKGLVVGEEARRAGGPDLFKAVLEIGYDIPKDLSIYRGMITRVGWILTVTATTSRPLRIQIHHQNEHHNLESNMSWTKPAIPKSK